MYNIIILIVFSAYKNNNKYFNHGITEIIY